jgi:2-polyprenyl-3-methyl-5-hydroxy-6-metoxy-1,4-benzoquinol methylase
VLKRTVRAVVRAGLRPVRVRRLVESELARMRTPSSTAAKALAAPPWDPATERTFVDRFGVAHPLDPTLRDRLKPQWRAMFDADKMSRTATDEEVAERVRKATKTVGDAAGLVEAVTGTALRGRILEVGCYDGANATALARMPGTTVVASDMDRYYVVQRSGQVADAELERQSAAMDALRIRTRAAAGVPEGSLRFVQDDITASELEPGSFDAIVSFEVLEHVQRPEAALASMAKLVRPGGLLVHDYNPFFSAIGGHSLCTLDFPWGHVRLDRADFVRYLEEIRPTEVGQALPFYEESLNRLTLADLRAAIADAGLELLALVPWTDRSLVGRITPDTLAEVRRAYPRAGMEDLVATFVAVIARRPS